MAQFIEFGSDFKVKNDGGTCFYQCPTTTWRIRGTSDWKGTTTEWKPCSDLVALLVAELEDESGG